MQELSISQITRSGEMFTELLTLELGCGLTIDRLACEINISSQTLRKYLLNGAGINVATGLKIYNYLKKVKRIEITEQATPPMPLKTEERRKRVRKSALTDLGD